MSRRCRRCCRCGRLRWWCAGGTNSHSSSIFPPCSGGRASCANAFAQGRAHGVSTATCVSLCYAEWYRPKRKRASKTITLSPYVRWRFIASVTAYRRGQRLLHCRDTTCPNYGTTSNIIIIDAVGLMAVTHRGVVIPEHAALIMVGIYITKTHTDIETWPGSTDEEQTPHRCHLTTWCIQKGYRSGTNGPRTAENAAAYVFDSMTL